MMAALWDASSWLDRVAHHMLSDLFWDVATSDLALAILAALWLAAFVVAHLTGLVERLWPQAYAYAKAAALIQLIAAAALCFLIGFRVSDERAEARQLRRDLDGREAELQQLRVTAEDAEKLRAEAEARAQQAQGELNEFRTTYADRPAADPAGAACAFTADDLDRLRQLNGAPAAAGLGKPSALDRMRALGGRRR